MRSKLPFLFLLLFAIQAFCEKTSIAVTQFDATNMAEGDVRILTDRLRSELIEIGVYNVVERSLMEEILKEQNFQQSGCVSNECVVEVGKLVGVEQIVAGSIGKLGSIYTISARMVDVQSGSIMDQWLLDCPCSIETMLQQSMRAVALRISDKYFLDFTNEGGDRPSTASEMLALARSFLDDKHYTEAVSGLRYLISQFPGSSEAPEAQYMLGDTYMAYTKDFEQAIKEYRKVLDNYAESRIAPNAQFMIGYIYANFLYDYVRAKEAYEKFLRDFSYRVDEDLIESVRFELENLGKDLEEMPTLRPSVPDYLDLLFGEPDSTNETKKE